MLDGKRTKHSAAESHILKNITMQKLDCCVEGAKLMFTKLVVLDMQMLHGLKMHQV